MKSFPSQLKAGTVGHVHSQIFRTLFVELETENDYVQSTDDTSIIIVDDKNETFDIFKELVDLRKKSPLNIICAYLNINSYRYKYEHIIELLQRNRVDILFQSQKQNWMTLSLTPCLMLTFFLYIDLIEIHIEEDCWPTCGQT